MALIAPADCWAVTAQAAPVRHDVRAVDDVDRLEALVARCPPKSSP
jgi:hypothetical protein